MEQKQNKLEETQIGEPKIGEPKIEESQIEEPKIEEPKIEESQEFLEEYNTASVAEQQARIKLLMEDKSICFLKQPEETEDEEHQSKYKKKIQLNTPLIDYEWEISQKIQEIPHTHLYFATIVEPPTTIEIGSITEDNIEKCTQKLPKKTLENTQKLVTTTYRNRKSILLIDYIFQQKTTNIEYTFMTIIETFQQLLYSIQKLQLQKNPIIIFDIQLETIFYDLLHNTPFFTDHRLAINSEDLKDKQNCKKLIPHYELPYPISIEIWLLSNIIELDPQATFDKELRDRWITEYSETIPIQSPRQQSFIEEYKTSIDAFQTWDTLLEELIKTSNTWDIYILAMNYYQLCSQLQLDHLRVKLDENSHKYIFLETWYETLEDIILNLPNNRPTIDQIIEKMKGIEIVDREDYASFLREISE